MEIKGNVTTGTDAQLVERTLDILEAMAGEGAASLPEIARRAGLPVTTAHRILQALIRRGYAMRVARGQYWLGSSVLALAETLSIDDLLAAATRRHMLALSRAAKCHVHLGLWQDGMVTYLVKQRYGKTRLHSAEGAQLEAYCSALGKVLLAGLSGAERDAYLGEGGFVPLTPHTIVDPAQLDAEIAMVQVQGWGSDREEIAMGLCCCAVPLRDPAGMTIAALSVSMAGTGRASFVPSDHVQLLQETAAAIERQLFPAMAGAG
ncbi:MAG: IclR family transcriptional regulator [Blastomonas sp.]